MNNTILEMWKNAKEQTKEEEQMLKKFDEMVEKNNQIFYMNIYQKLIEEYQKDPINYIDWIRIDIPLQSQVKDTSKLTTKVLPMHKSQEYYWCYESKTGLILININDVYHMLVDDGFTDDNNDLIIYFDETSGYKAPDTVKEFHIKIDVSKFKSIMNDQLAKAKEQQKNSDTGNNTIEEQGSMGK